MLKTSKHQNRRLLFVALLVLWNLALAACGTRSPQPNPAATTRPQRIVSLSPNVTEILYGVGAWPQVVAVSQYCTYPEDVKNKPRVDGWRDTNLEQVMALKPDLVIGVDTQAPFVQDKLNALGMHTLFVTAQNLADVIASIKEIGRAVGHEQQGVELAQQTQREIDAVRSSVANRSRPRVLFIVDRVPGTLRDLYTATRGSFLDDLVGIAGGESIAPPSEHGYGKITKEAVLALDPEVIIDIVHHSEGKLSEDPVAVWHQLSEVRAVREGRIYSLSDPMVVHPSQFVGRTAKILAQSIHPEAFPNEPR